MTAGLRVLHLFANYKWTGPADPAIRAAVRLRDLGFDVVFAQADWTHPGGDHRMSEELWRWRVPVVTGLELRKHFRLGSLFGDVRALRRLIARDGYHILHCHQTADHLIAALAVAGMPAPPRLVRSLYDPEPPRRGWRSWLSFRRTDAVVAPAPAVARAMTAIHGLAAERVLLQEPVVEHRQSDGPDLRARWGLESDHLVVGITARIQPHRRFDLLWRTARYVVDRLPRARFVLLGRGNERDTEELVHGPVRDLDLGGHVVLPGYLKEPDYSAALRSLDLFLFLVPGSDGTCRAVREAMAARLPVVCTARGILPELVRPRPGGPAPGAVCEEHPEALGSAVLALLEDPARRGRAAAAAGDRARTDMDPAAAARALGDLYSRLGGGDEACDDGPVVSRWWGEVCRTGSLPRDTVPVQGRLVRQVGRAELPSGPAFLKVMSFPRWKDRLRYLVRDLPAAHEARMLAMAAAAGIPCPQVIAVRTARRRLLPHRSLLVLRALPTQPGARATSDAGRLLEERATLARALLDAGILHKDLNESNFVRLADGRLAVLDLQSARPTGAVARAGRQMAVRLLLEAHDVPVAQAREILSRKGLLNAADAGAEDAASALGSSWLAGRVRRCLCESTEFERRVGLHGVEYRFRGPWPPGRWQSGGRELLRCWLGQRALQVVEDRPPVLFAFRRTWWWFPGRWSVYIPARFAKDRVVEELQTLVEGSQRYRWLLTDRQPADLDTVRSLRSQYLKQPGR